MKAKCTHCDGKGILEKVKQRYGFPMCPVCLGSGEIDVKKPIHKKKSGIMPPDSNAGGLHKRNSSNDVKCPTCDGTGKFQEIYDCHVCLGAGIISGFEYNKRFATSDTSDDSNCYFCKGTGCREVGYSFNNIKPEMVECSVCNGTGNKSKTGKNKFAKISKGKTDFVSRQSSAPVSNGLNINPNLILFIVVMFFLLLIKCSSSNSNSNNSDAILKSAEQKMDRGDTDSMTDQEKRAVDKIWNNKNN